MAEAQRTADWPAAILGFALGGFFDGILLHQILQWHHLLSGLDGRDVRFQVAADGYFHALMYLIAAVGLWALWRGRDRTTGRGVVSGMLVGFGVWHVIDSVLSHWVTGIHRIRMDAANPLVWDLVWLVVFGVVPILIGWWMRQAGGTVKGGGGPAVAAILITLGAGGLALRPAGGAAFSAAVFHDGVSEAAAMEAVASVGGQVAWIDSSGRVVVFERASIAQPMRLYGKGAILVGGAGVPAGCLGWLAA